MKPRDPEYDAAMKAARRVTWLGKPPKVTPHSPEHPGEYDDDRRPTRKAG